MVDRASRCCGCAETLCRHSTGPRSTAKIARFNSITCCGLIADRRRPNCDRTCSKCFKRWKTCCAPRLRIAQFTFHFGPIEFLPVDGPIVSRLRHALRPAARAEQAVKVDARHAAQRQHDRVGGDKPIDLQGQRFIAVRIGQRIEIVDVQLVGAGRSIGIGFVRHAPAMRQRPDRPARRSRRRAKCHAPDSGRCHHARRGS